MTEKALEYLNKDPLSHVDMIEQIRRGTGKLTYAESNGVMLTYNNGKNAMLSCDSLELAKKLLGNFEYEMVGIHQSWMSEELCKHFDLPYCEECWQGIYTGKEPLPLPEADIRMLDLDHLDTIAAVYQHGDRDFVRNVIEQKLMYGIFVDNMFAGFVGKHVEGAIGLLEIMPEFRRRGLAGILNSFYINLELSKGYTPFGQVIVGNEASRKLNEKLGLEFAKETMCWIWKD